ncbi:unnamed protein product [Adineta steineri]|uniref:Uncharacterized protein n=1 Tax=Adineta steineri TaxID=433720 RepID=A0A815I8R0_9BILA|nr:unnamed protein product [Adineta steineri]
MPSNKVLLIQWIIIFIVEEPFGSAGLCSGNSSKDSTPVFLITFGSGADLYSNNTSSSFNFTTNHTQVFDVKINDGQFGFVNKVPPPHRAWQNGSLDYTGNGIHGYMFLVNVANKTDAVIFSSTINDLCIGLLYEFSAYLTNVNKPPATNRSAPNVRFVVRAATFQGDILGNSSTGNISAADNMPWRKYGVSFTALNSSVVLLIISNVGINKKGNDLAIDNIELRGCSNNHYRLCPSGSANVCSVNNTNNSTSVFLITFDSGADLYSNNTYDSFNFTTDHEQVFNSTINDGEFGFVNKVPPPHGSWHQGELDYTENDTDGYMFFVNVAHKRDAIIFNSTINGLCTGLRYEFTAYLANVLKPSANQLKPNVRFEVRAASPQGDILENSMTCDIPTENNMTWRKYGVLFTALDSSVVLLIISNVENTNGGNDLAIDNIELRDCPNNHSCSNNQSRLCPSDETTTPKYISSPPTTTTDKPTTSQHISTVATTTTDMNEPSTSQHISSSSSTTTTTTIDMNEPTTSQNISSSSSTTTTTIDMNEITTSQQIPSSSAATTIDMIKSSTNTLSTFIFNTNATTAAQEKGL